MYGHIDIHCHIAWGMDDGAQSQKEAYDMILAACRDGVGWIIATPHMTPGIRYFDRELLNSRVDALNAFCEQQKLAMAVYPGCEMLYTDAALRLLERGDVPTLAGSKFLLTEFDYLIDYHALYDALRMISNAGYVPVLAHVERYGCLLADPRRARDIHDKLDVRLQMNCTTALHARNFKIWRLRQCLMDANVIDYIATDAHNTSTRKTCMYDAYMKTIKLRGEEYAYKLAFANQRQIFTDYA